MWFVEFAILYGKMEKMCAAAAHHMVKRATMLNCRLIDPFIKKMFGVLDLDQSNDSECTILFLFLFFNTQYIVFGYVTF